MYNIIRSTAAALQAQVIDLRLSRVLSGIAIFISWEI